MDHFDVTFGEFQGFRLRRDSVSRIVAQSTEPDRNERRRGDAYGWRARGSLSMLHARRNDGRKG